MKYKKFIPLTYDLAIKAFFCFDTKLTKYFLEAVSPINEIDDLKIIGNEAPVTNMNAYHMTTDLMFEVNCKTELNIEVNRALFEIVFKMIENALFKVQCERSYKKLVLSKETIKDNTIYLLK